MNDAEYENKILELYVRQMTTNKYNMNEKLNTEKIKKFDFKTKKNFTIIHKEKVRV